MRVWRKTRQAKNSAGDINIKAFAPDDAQHSDNRLLVLSLSV